MNKSVSQARISRLDFTYLSTILSSISFLLKPRLSHCDMPAIPVEWDVTNRVSASLNKKQRVCQGVISNQ